MSRETPWHLLDLLKQGEWYRTQEGGEILFKGLDGMCAKTDDGPIYLGPFLRDILDPEQFQDR